MKTFLTIVFFLFTLYGSSQVNVRSASSEGFEERIRNYVDQIRIVDTHEHLIAEEDFLNRKNLDFLHLFHWYIADDMVSSGINSDTLKRLRKADIPPLEKWEMIKPYWELSKMTAYGRSILLTLKNLYGIEDINDSTCLLLTKKVRENQKSGWYREILKNKAGIDVSINDIYIHKNPDRDLFKYVMRYDNFVLVHSKDEIVKQEQHYGQKIQNLDDYMKALDKAFQEGIDFGMVGVKSALAYERPLFFEECSKEQAETIFNTLMQENNCIDFEKVKPLQDFVMHHILQLASTYKMPVTIHTGLHAGLSFGRNQPDITWSDPTHLINLFSRYPEVKFALMHGSYPYGGELAAMVKNYPNVYIDMCWLYIISPSYSTRYLNEWIETIPLNRIMGFGGDLNNVEAVYGHALLARQIVTGVLIEKVASGYLSEEEAKYAANKILRENAISFFQLDAE